MDAGRIHKLLAGTEVLRWPRRRLATFGATRVDYQLVSDVDGAVDRTRLREGSVLSRKPRILTPDALRERFEGFGPDSQDFVRWASAAYRDLLRALEYNFVNQGLTTRVLNDPPPLVAERITAEIDAGGDSQRALLRCPDAGWPLALMKLTLDEAARSFPGHVQDLERRGAFEPDGGEAQRRQRRVEALFADVAAGAASREELGARLREWGLFAEYEDRYLSLFRP